MTKGKRRRKRETNMTRNTVKTLRWQTMLEMGMMQKKTRMAVRRMK